MSNGFGGKGEDSRGVEKVELIGENGEKLVFILDAVFNVDKKEYAVLSSEEAEDEAILMKIVYDSDRNPMFTQIEDDYEFDVALDEYEKLMDDMEGQY